MLPSWAEKHSIVLVVWPGESKLEVNGGRGEAGHTPSMVHNKSGWQVVHSIVNLSPLVWTITCFSSTKVRFLTNLMPSALRQKNWVVFSNVIRGVTLLR